MGLEILKWIKRKKIDPQGVKNELMSAIRDNGHLEGNFIEIGKDRFFNLLSENVFKITHDKNGKRMIRELTDKEKTEIERDSPPAIE